MIKKTLGAPVEMQKGRSGQFEIVVDGRPVVSRRGGLLAKILGRPWPGDEEVLTAVRKAIGPASG